MLTAFEGAAPGAPPGAGHTASGPPAGQQEGAALLVRPHPTHPLVRAFLKGPILLWRLGLGPLVGRRFLILTTRGRKTGLPRHTAIAFHTYAGRIYVYNAHGPRADWYRNLSADSRVTVQTAQGTAFMIARRVWADAELADAYEFLSQHPILRQWTHALGMELTPEHLIAAKERFFLVTFDPTDEETPPAVAPDLIWVWAVAVGSFLLGWLVGRTRAGGRDERMRRPNQEPTP